MMNPALAKAMAAGGTPKQGFSVLCTTHESVFGIARPVENYYGEYLEVEAMLAQMGWTGDTPATASCPDCSRRSFAIKPSGK